MPQVFEDANIAAKPTSYSFKMGSGFRYIGEPAIPAEPVGDAGFCEPSIDFEEGSWHRLKAPSQAEGAYVRMQWIPSKRCWAPPLVAQGRRIAFSSTYLAAVGWRYVEAE